MVLLLVLLFIVILYAVYLIRKDLKYIEKITLFANQSLDITLKELYEMRNWSGGGKYNFAGVYILLNVTKNNKPYIGQSLKVLDRAKDHFVGKGGNKDIYADYKKGDNFIINAISLENSKFGTLNNLERHYIEKFDSYNNGYNKTKGNR